MQCPRIKVKTLIPAMRKDTTAQQVLCRPKRISVETESWPHNFSSLTAYFRDISVLDKEAPRIIRDGKKAAAFFDWRRGAN